MRRDLLTDKPPVWWRGVLLLLCIATLAMPSFGAAQAARPRQNFTPSIYLPVLLNNDCNGTRDATNPIGLQTYGATNYGQPDYDLLQETQSSWVRSHIDWYTLEPANVEPSEYRWAVSDRSLGAANDHCMNMIVTIDGTPRWAATSHIHSPYRAEMEAEFVQFVGAVVERYDGDGRADAFGSPVINYWEFYNEPDVGGSELGDGWGVSPGAYAAMLKAVYPIVKKANPNAQVVFGGISYDNFIENGGIFVRDFLEQVLKAGGGKYFDIMNIHYYPFHAHRTRWTKTKSSGLREKVEHIHAELAKYKLTKPLMITEVGWHSNDASRDPSTTEYQSRYVVQLLTQAKAAGAEAVIWWTFIDTLTYPFKSGVATHEHTRKPAYAAYVEAVRRVGEARNLHILVEPTRTSDLEIYEARQAGTGRTIYIGWLNPIAPFNAEAVATFNDELAQSWQAPGLVARVIGKNGKLKHTVKDADDGASDGMLTFSVGTDPVYIVVDVPAGGMPVDETPGDEAPGDTVPEE